MSDVTKLSFSMPTALFVAYEREAKVKDMRTTELMREALSKYARDEDWKVEDSGFDMELYRKVTTDVADAAERLINANGWKEDITLLAIRDRQSDPVWLAAYRKLIGDENEFVAGNGTKASVNQNFGQYVKIRLQAQNKIDADGKRVTKQVAGELVRTYTLLVPGS